jgi:hypothetical protein
MADSNRINRRNFLGVSAASVAAAGLAGGAAAPAAKAGEAAPAAPAKGEGLPLATLGKAKISRMMLGGNLVSGYMHSRDLHYVNNLFRAYVTEAKMLETLAMAEAQGINTVFETGANFVQKYNREFGGKMQFIPHIQVTKDQPVDKLEDHIQKQVDSGAVALYVWGVAGDTLVEAGAIDDLHRAVDMAKAHSLPVGVGSHSLLVPMACEKAKVPCDFYVKTFHRDDYPSATPKPQRKEFIWLHGGPGWYDNMWCLNPEETAEFMAGVEKPWVAFKVLAAGAIKPEQGFAHAFNNGADLIAVGMFDFQVEENCACARKAIRAAEKRARPWRA